VADTRVHHAHEVQCLHHVRAVLARQREIRLEGEVALEIADLVEQFLLDLRRIAAHLQQREHQRSELVAERDAGEGGRHVAADAPDGKRGSAVGIAVTGDGDLVRQRSDLVQQLSELARRLALIERGDELDRLDEPFEIGLELGLEFGFEHVRTPHGFSVRGAALR
jgi:hypothetical protein